LVLLGTAEFGHLTWTRRAVPLTVPAHYLLDGDHVLIDASTGGNPDHWRDRVIVALHVDAFDAHQRAGWSMFLAGAAPEVANLVRAGDHLPCAVAPAGGGNASAVSTDLAWEQHFGPARGSNRDH